MPARVGVDKRVKEGSIGRYVSSREKFSVVGSWEEELEHPEVDVLVLD